MNEISRSFKNGLSDLIAGLEKYRIFTVYGWLDIRQKYRRSVLGPLWITLSMGIMILALGVVFSRVLKTSLTEYIPYLTIGYIVWGLISSVLREGTGAFVSNEGMIKQINIPKSIYVLRIFWRNIIVFSHNLLIYPLVCIVMQFGLNWRVLWAVPGFILLIFNLFWVTLLISVLCTRFRDCKQIIESIIQVAFYVTPIIWMPGAISQRSAVFILDPNPLYHLINLVRCPLLGQATPIYSLNFCLIMAIVGWGISLIVFGKSKDKLAFWL